MVDGVRDDVLSTAVDVFMVVMEHVLILCLISGKSRSVRTVDQHCTQYKLASIQDGEVERKHNLERDV